MRDLCRGDFGGAGVLRDERECDLRLIGRSESQQQRVIALLLRSRGAGLERERDAFDRGAAARALVARDDSLHGDDDALRDRARHELLRCGIRQATGFADERAALGIETRGRQRAAVGEHRREHGQVKRGDGLVLEADRVEAGLEVVEDRADRFA